MPYAKQANPFQHPCAGRRVLAPSTAKIASPLTSPICNSRSKKDFNIRPGLICLMASKKSLRDNSIHGNPASSKAASHLKTLKQIQIACREKCKGAHHMATKEDILGQIAEEYLRNRPAYPPCPWSTGLTR